METRRLSADEARDAVDDLAAVLLDCVDGGASVSFLQPFGREDAVAFFESLLPEVAAGTRVLVGAYDEDGLVGTVQLIHAGPPNQPHSADIAKLLVHRRARGRGVAQALMAQVEEEARRDGKSLLVLDTVTGTPAYALYRKLGWTVVGEIPGYALDVRGSPEPTTIFFKRV